MVEQQAHVLHLDLQTLVVNGIGVAAGDGAFLLVQQALQRTFLLLGGLVQAAGVGQFLLGQFPCFLFDTRRDAVHLRTQLHHLGVIFLENLALALIIRLQVGKGALEAVDDCILLYDGEFLVLEAAQLAVGRFTVDAFDLGLGEGLVEIGKFLDHGAFASRQVEQFLAFAVILQLGLLLAEVAAQLGDLLGDELGSLPLGLGLDAQVELDEAVEQGVDHAGGGRTVRRDAGYGNQPGLLDGRNHELPADGGLGVGVGEDIVVDLTLQAGTLQDVDLGVEVIVAVIETVIAGEVDDIGLRLDHQHTGSDEHLGLHRHAHVGTGGKDQGQNDDQMQPGLDQAPVFFQVDPFVKIHGHDAGIGHLRHWIFH